MKRQVIAPSSSDLTTKKAKAMKYIIDDQQLDILEELQSVQSQLLELDDQCVKEQLQIQRKFAGRMRPLMMNRQKIIDKIPHFWCRVLSNLPLDEDHVLCQEDMDVLQELQVLDLDDNIDDRGSYKLTLKFSDKVKQYFSPTVIEKLILFEDKEREPVVSCTKIEWVPGQNIVEKVQERRRHCQETDEEDVEFSIFEWFTDVVDTDSIQLGELIRRQVWQNPMLFLCDGLDDESDIPEEDDDEEEEDEENEDEENEEDIQSNEQN